jgi:hypothetical protein
MVQGRNVVCAEDAVQGCILKGERVKGLSRGCGYSFHLQLRGR